VSAYDEAVRDLAELRRGKFDHQRTAQANGTAARPAQHGTPAQADEPQPPRRLYLTTFEDIDDRHLEPMRYLIAPHLPAGEATLLFAPPRNFKSFLAMEWALSVALGRPLFDRYEAQQGLVFYFDLENRLDRLRERIRASLARTGHERRQLEGRLLIQDRGKDVPPWRMDSEAMAQLSEAVGDYEPALVVIDNFRKALPAGLSENKNEEVNPILNGLVTLCEQVEAALLLVHHTNKGYEQFSGAGCLESTPANMIKIQREPQSAVATVSCVNMRNAEDWEPFGLTMGASGALQLTEPVTGSVRHEDRVRRALEAGSRTIGELADQTGLSEGHVRSAIEGLRAKGLAIELGTRPSGSRGAPPKVYGLAAD
jgi:hypothetical protein